MGPGIVNAPNQQFVRFQGPDELDRTWVYLLFFNQGGEREVREPVFYS